MSCKYSRCDGLTSVTIGNNVTTISHAAFSYCTKLTSIKIPQSVTSIGNYAFADCTCLTSITIPNSVTSIGEGAYEYCSGLTSITIPNCVSSIGNYAFRNCSCLTSLTIGGGFKTIGSEAFAYCLELQDVYCYAEIVPSTSINAFENSYVEHATLHVPETAINNYKKCNPWSGFGTFMILNGSVITDKCSTPDISYVNGKIVFSCETDGAEFVSEITDADINKHYDHEVVLTATYNISVYAMATDYENSDVATATLCWIDVEPIDQVATGTLEIAAVPVLVKSRDGVITVEGISNNTSVTVYTTDGVLVGSATATNHTATISTSLTPGTVAIVNLGKKSVKIMVR